MLTLRITPRGAPPVTVSQLEGKFIRTGLIGKTIYCFSTALSDSKKGTFTIKVFTASRMSGSGMTLNESLKEVRTLVLNKTQDRYLVTYRDEESSIKIEILTVQNVLEPEEGRPEADARYLRSAEGTLTPPVTPYYFDLRLISIYWRTAYSPSLRKLLIARLFD